MRPISGLRTLGFASLAVVLGAVAASAQAPADPTGTWLTEEGKARIKIDRCAGDKSAMCGTVVWLREPLNEQGQPKTDPYNPDPAKRSRPALGMVIMQSFKPNTEGRYAGRIYSAENGKEYDSSIALKSPTALELKGCVMGGLFCGGQTWTRVADVPAPGNQAAAGRGQPRTP